MTECDGSERLIGQRIAGGGHQSIRPKPAVTGGKRRVDLLTVEEKIAIEVRNRIGDKAARAINLVDEIPGSDLKWELGRAAPNDDRAITAKGTLAIGRSR